METKKTIKRFRDFSNFRKATYAEDELILNFMSKKLSETNKIAPICTLFPALFFGVPIGILGINNPEQINSSVLIMLAVLITLLGIIPAVYMVVNDKRLHKVVDTREYEVAKCFTYSHGVTRRIDKPDEFYFYIQNDEGEYCSKKVYTDLESYREMENEHKVLEVYVIKYGKKTIVLQNSLLKSR